MVRGAEILSGMEALLAFGRAEGLTDDEAQRALRLNRPATDAGWVAAQDVGPEAWAIAKGAPLS